MLCIISENYIQCRALNNLEPKDILFFFFLGCELKLKDLLALGKGSTTEPARITHLFFLKFKEKLKKKVFVCLLSRIIAYNLGNIAFHPYQKWNQMNFSHSIRGLIYVNVSQKICTFLQLTICFYLNWGYTRMVS